MEICVQCGRKVLGECLNPKCKEYWQKLWENKIDGRITDYQKEVGHLKKVDAGILSLEDYSEVKKMKLEVNKWNKELGSSPTKSEAEKLLKDIEEVENKFPERIKLKYRFKNSSGYQPSCSHKNIEWNDFFKSFKEKTEEPYCLDCGEDENNGFTKTFQKWYCKKIEEWLKDHGFKKHEFNSWLKKTADNHYDIWWELKKGKFIESMKGELTIFQEMSEYIENYCLEFAEKKGINLDNQKSKIKNQKSKIKNQKSKIKNQKSTPTFFF